MNFLSLLLSVMTRGIPFGDGRREKLSKPLEKQTRSETFSGQKWVFQKVDDRRSKRELRRILVGFNQDSKLLSQNADVASITSISSIINNNNRAPNTKPLYVEVSEQIFLHFAITQIFQKFEFFIFNNWCTFRRWWWFVENMNFDAHYYNKV